MGIDCCTWEVAVKIPSPPPCEPAVLVTQAQMVDQQQRQRAYSPKCHLPMHRLALQLQIRQQHQLKYHRKQWPSDPRWARALRVVIWNNDEYVSAHG